MPTTVEQRLAFLAPVILAQDQFARPKQKGLTCLHGINVRKALCIKVYRVWCRRPGSSFNLFHNSTTNLVVGIKNLVKQNIGFLGNIDFLAFRALQRRYVLKSTSPIIYNCSYSL